MVAIIHTQNDHKSFKVASTLYTFVYHILYEWICYGSPMVVQCKSRGQVQWAAAPLLKSIHSRNQIGIGVHGQCMGVWEELRTIFSSRVDFYCMWIRTMSQLLIYPYRRGLQRSSGARGTKEQLLSNHSVCILASNTLYPRQRVCIPEDYFGPDLAPDGDSALASLSTVHL